MTRPTDEALARLVELAKEKLAKEKLAPPEPWILADTTIRHSGARHRGNASYGAARGAGAAHRSLSGLMFHQHPVEPPQSSVRCARSSKAREGTFLGVAWAQALGK